jgi:hypothetical protein
MRGLLDHPELVADLLAAVAAGEPLYIYGGTCAVTGRGQYKRHKRQGKHVSMGSSGGIVYGPDIGNMASAYQVEKEFCAGCPRYDPNIIWVNEKPGGIGGGRQHKHTRWCVYLLWSRLPPHLCSPPVDVPPTNHRAVMQASGWLPTSILLQQAYMKWKALPANSSGPPGSQTRAHTRAGPPSEHSRHRAGCRLFHLCHAQHVLCLCCRRVHVACSQQPRIRIRALQQRQLGV